MLWVRNEDVRESSEPECSTKKGRLVSYDDMMDGGRRTMNTTTASNGGHETLEGTKKTTEHGTDADTGPG